MILAFFAIVIGSVLLYLELQTYGEWPQWKIRSAPPPAAAPSARLVVPAFTETAAIRSVAGDVRYG